MCCGLPAPLPPPQDGLLCVFDTHNLTEDEALVAVLNTEASVVCAQTVHVWCAGLVERAQSGGGGGGGLWWGGGGGLNLYPSMCVWRPAC